MKAPHLPFSCKFNDNKTLASYATGIYDYYDVEKIEEFVAFMGAYEIESVFKECENPVDSLEISLFDNACYACGQDANMNYAYGDELAIVPYVKQ